MAEEAISIATYLGRECLAIKFGTMLIQGHGKQLHVYWIMQPVKHSRRHAPIYTWMPINNSYRWDCSLRKWLHKFHLQVLGLIFFAWMECGTTKCNIMCLPSQPLLLAWCRCVYMYMCVHVHVRGVCVYVLCVCIFVCICEFSFHSIYYTSSSGSNPSYVYIHRQWNRIVYTMRIR